MSKKVVIEVKMHQMVSDDDKYILKFMEEEREMFKTQMIDDLQRSLRFDYEDLIVDDIDFEVLNIINDQTNLDYIGVCSD